MNPSDLGLPPKFTKFYDSQEDIAIDIACSGKRFRVDAAPTGIGKSIIYMTVAKMTDSRTLILTANKGLQNQLIADFGAIGLVDIRGQSNYPCRILTTKPGDPYHGCDEGPCHFGEPCQFHPRDPGFTKGCTFYDALRKASKSKLVVSNYDFFMNLNRHMDPDAIGDFDMLALDEAHEAPDKLSEFMSVELHEDNLQDLLDAGLPTVEDGQESWAAWAQGLVPTCRIALESMKTESKRSMILKYTILLRKLETLAKCGAWRRADSPDPPVRVAGMSTDWVAEEMERKRGQSRAVLFSPIWAHPYAEDYLFARIPKVVLVSATIIPKTTTYLGIKPEDMEFKSHDSVFHPERRPVIWVPTVRVSQTMTEAMLTQWVRKIDNIIDQRLDRKGIIHTVSYQRAQFLFANSRHKSIMMAPGSRDLRSVVELFKKFRSAKVLVSPAVSTGWDFPYTECEYQIIVKVPFVYHGSALMRARAQMDKNYLNYLTALSLIQMSGRGMRAKDDRCETIIVDDNIQWFMQAAKKAGLIPKWYLDAYKPSFDKIPTPMEKLK